MAISFTYNATYSNCAYIYRTTGGGTVFSANLNVAAFDYFTDTAVVNDAVYFSPSFATYAPSNLKVNVGTPIAGIGVTGVWEYYAKASTTTAAMWRPIHNLTDPTNGLTVAGLNTIVFPIQAGAANITINGISGRCWIRYRITGGTVTEGGANITTIPQTATGTVTVDGGTDAVPATLTNLYDWVSVNVPEVGATRLGSTFNFPNMVLSINSRLKTTNEILFLGNGGDMPHYFDYLESGVKEGTDGWSNPSFIFFCYASSGSRLRFTTSTKVYGGTFSVFSNVVDGLTWPSAGYIGLGDGEFIGLNVETLVSGYFGTLINANRCTTRGQIITTNFPNNYPNNHRISMTGTNLIGLYKQGGTVRNLSYVTPTTSVFNFNQNGGETSTVNMINCTPILPAQTDAVKVVARAHNPLTSALLNVFYWDASANSFTDYTTAADNATTNDVPLTGDVGDCYYFRATTSNAYQMPLNMTITNQANDYTYVWEYWSNAWLPMNKVWDGTSNFTKSGIIYLAHDMILATTINSVSGLWMRCRITGKGNATPTFSTVKSGLNTGVGDWRINEKMTCTFTVIDKEGNALPGAKVTITDALDNSTELTAGVNGTVSSDVTISVTQFDPNESDTNYNVKKTSMNPVTITVENPGYQTLTKVMTITGQVTETLPLERKKIHTFNVI